MQLSKSEEFFFKALLEYTNNNLEDKEKDTLQNLSNQSIEEIKSESEFDMIDDYNHYDGETESERKEDDLLQIPAFLRRQAN